MTRTATTRSGGLLTGAAVLAMLAGGCTEKLVQPPPPPTVLTVPDSVQSIFTANCALSNCHTGPNPAQGMDLSDARTAWLNTVGVASTQRSQFLRIAPGDSADSYVVMKLRNDPRKGGQPMPLGGFPLDATLVLRVAAWAQNGAPGTPVVARAPVAAFAASERSTAAPR